MAGPIFFRKLRMARAGVLIRHSKLYGCGTCFRHGLTGADTHIDDGAANADDSGRGAHYQRRAAAGAADGEGNQ